MARSLRVEAGEVSERVLLADELPECDAFEVVSALRGRRAAILVP